MGQAKLRQSNIRYRVTESQLYTASNLDQLSKRPPRPELIIYGPLRIMFVFRSDGNRGVEVRAQLPRW